MHKIPKRVSTALINALAAGVVPRVGLEHIAVGREREIAALSQDLENIGKLTTPLLAKATMTSC
jgi:hypothetical protein